MLYSLKFFIKFYKTYKSMASKHLVRVNQYDRIKVKDPMTGTVYRITDQNVGSATVQRQKRYANFVCQ